jgi:NADPH:quinone reductase-like Zn-dependent oxidoreductase
MKAARVLRFGPPNVIINDDLPRPEPAVGQLLVRVKAAGVGNWAALIREGKRLERKFRSSRLATKYTGQQTSNSPERTQNMRCLWPE